jgi:sodium/bile acid cotransporter 7
LGLKTKELTNSLRLVKFHTAVQVFSFGVDSSIVFGVTRFLAAVMGPSFQTLADGMLVCSCLPMTINCAIILTQTAHGDEASAIFNSALGNLVGIFLSPILILGYLGVSGEVDIVRVFSQLCARVVAPFLFGQLLHLYCPPVVAFSQKYKRYFKLTQQYALTYIVYCTFCTTFQNREDPDYARSTLGDVMIMIAFQFCLMCTLMVLSWYTFQYLFPNQPQQQVMALFGTTHKTIAMGIPLINSFYQGNPLVGIYILPLLVWHPMQLVLGSVVAAKLAPWVDKEVERLKAVPMGECELGGEETAAIDAITTDTTAGGDGGTTTNDDHHKDDDGVPTTTTTTDQDEEGVEVVEDVETGLKGGGTNDS